MPLVASDPFDFGKPETIKFRSYKDICQASPCHNGKATIVFVDRIDKFICLSND